MQHDVVVERFGNGGQTFFMNLPCRRVGLPRRSFLLCVRDHGKRTGIGQCLDGFMRLRHLVFRKRALERKEGIQTFRFGRLVVGQNTVQKFHRLCAGRIGIGELFFPHGRMNFLPCLCAELYSRAQRGRAAKP